MLEQKRFEFPHSRWAHRKDSSIMSKEQLMARRKFNRELKISVVQLVNH